ncbi:B3 domain-containing protein Os01g0234100 [Linum grandiflorum]
MDASDEPLSPPAPSPSDQLPLNQHIALYPHFKVSRRKSRGSRMKPHQIHPTKSPEHPDSKSQLVLFDNTPDSKRQRRAAVNDLYDSAETKSTTLERAEDFRATLSTDMPSFAKTLVRSNVTVGFWMHLPMRFCKSHLPKTDTTVLVQSENGSEYVINYIAERTALSGGWKAFCGAHKLNEGDVLVFQMVKPLQFKVYVVRGNGSSAKVEEEDTYSRRKQMITADRGETEYSRSRKRLESPPPAGLLREKHEENGLVAIEKSNDQSDPSSENMEIVASPEPALDLMDISCIEDFSVVVNGTAIDEELSDHHRKKYYELCSSQKAILHRNLLNSISCKLAAEIISGTVDIAESIRSSSLSSSHGEYAVWEKNLKGFQFLGMKVGFLCERVDKLMKLAMESEAAVESERREVQMRQAEVSEEMESLELKLVELKQTRQRLDEEIEALKVTAERHEVMFQEVVNAPW